MNFTQPWNYGDVTFIIEDRKLHVNKGVLEMSSEVFSAMFTSEFKGKKMTEIWLPDKNFHDFLELMQILHPLPRIYVNDANVESLLQLADEYQIHHMLQDCEKVLVKQPPSIHNLILADRFSLSELRQVFFNHLKNVTYTQLEGHPEFKQVDKATRIEVFERHSMLQGPSVQNLFLAEKYDVSEMYDECLQYIRDTPLSKLKTEAGFTNLEPEILMEVLNSKVEKLELLEPLQTLKTEVSNITSWGKVDCHDRCGATAYWHNLSTNRDCPGCNKYRFDMIDEVMKKY